MNHKPRGRKRAAPKGMKLKPIAISNSIHDGDREQRHATHHDEQKRRHKKMKLKPVKKVDVDQLLQQTLLTAKSLRSQSVDDAGGTMQEVVVPTLHTISLVESKLKHAEDHHDGGYYSSDDDDLSAITGDNSFSYSPGRHRYHGYSPMFAAALGYDALASNRSVGSQSSIGSEYSLSTQRTQRELLSEIRHRAERNLRPPDYVMPFDEFAPEQLSWNKKLPRGCDKKHAPINIVPCMQPVELLLAKADMRTRKQRKTKQTRLAKIEEKVRRIDEGIQYKFSRAARYAAIAALKFRQMAFMRLIVITSFLHNIEPPFRHKLTMQVKFQKSVISGMTIERYCRHWYRRHLFIKYHLRFLLMLRRSEVHFRLFIRIWQKRKAVMKLTTFLQEFRHHHKMNVVVHKYLVAVRKVQRNIRAFLACKTGKVAVMALIWDKLEKVYVEKMLEKRKAKKRQTGRLKGLDAELAAVAGQDMIEMKSQAKLWMKIDACMEAKLKELKDSGVIKSESTEQVVQHHQLPFSIRDGILYDLLTELRREFYTSQRAVVRRKLDTEKSFHPQHAAELLRGDDSNISQIFRDKFEKRLVRLNYKPFMLLSAIDNKLIYDRIRAAHKKHGTFDINIDQFNNNSPASRSAANASMRKKLQY